MLSKVPIDASGVGSSDSLQVVVEDGQADEEVKKEQDEHVDVGKERDGEVEEMAGFPEDKISDHNVDVDEENDGEKDVHNSDDDNGKSDHGKGDGESKQDPKEDNANPSSKQDSDSTTPAAETSADAASEKEKKKRSSGRLPSITSASPMHIEAMRRRSRQSSVSSLPPLTSNFQRALNRWDSYSEMESTDGDQGVLGQSQQQQQQQQQQGSGNRRRASVIGTLSLAHPHSGTDTPPLVPPADQKRRNINIGPVMRLVLEKDPSRRTEEDRRVLFRFLSGLKEFEKFPEYIRSELCKVVLFKRCEEEVIIFNQHEYGTGWYTVLSGSCTVLVEKNHGKSVPVSILGPGDSFGERALVKSSSRTATVQAEEGTELLLVEKQDYVRTVKYAHEKDLMDKAEFLYNAPGLSKISRKVLSDLASYLQTKRYGPGEVIVFEGDEPEAFYAVHSGKCSVLMYMQVDFPVTLDHVKGRSPRFARPKYERVSKIVQIKTLVPGNYFGEISLITGTTRTATVVASEETIVLAVPKFEFLRICAGDAVAILKKNMQLYPTTEILEQKFIEMEQEIRWDKYKKRLVHQILDKKRG